MKNFDKDATIEALQKEVDTLRTIISMMPGNVFWRSLDGYYLGANANVARVVNYESVEEFIGKHPTDFMSAELASKVDKVDFEVIQTGKEQIVEEIGYNEYGPAIYLTRKLPYYDRQGLMQGVLGISFDITERKEIEEKLRIAKEKAESANRAKSQFLAMISHELRTPLTSIIGFANFIRQQDLTQEKIREYAGHILNSGSYLLSLINSLLDYNKLENNKFAIDQQPLEFKAMIESILIMLSAPARLKKLELKLVYDDNIPRYLMADDKIFQQILINLLGNAIKFTATGGVTVRVECVADEIIKVKLKISVEDTGIGIPLKEKKAIFRRFYQLENIYTRNESLTGTGLGLAIVKKLAALLKSKIFVESKPDEGSTFYFTVDLPVVLSPLNKDVVQKIKMHNNPYVLLVEDDTLIQIIHKQLLEDLHCRVDVVDSATKALEMMPNGYNILFVDIGLPDMPGIELIKKIRKLKTLKSQAKIVVLTGYSEKNESQKCLKAGADEIALKPISQEKLKEIIDRII
jgi:two-component system aerobic respiration control sensor histidine kinase ArcB